MQPLTNSHALALKVVGRGASLEDVRAIFIIPGQEHAHAVGALVVALGSDLIR